MVQSVSIEPKQHFTQPPARYSEATLIRTLEEKGVGRPSTYAPTLETIQRRYYVKLQQKRFEPTELGEIVNTIMEDFFPQVINTSFTAEMENDLDKVGAGQEDWISVVDRFYKPFEKELKDAEEKIEKIQIKDEPAGFDCELCGHPMVIKLGRFGKFYACSNFPDCRNTNECDFTSWINQWAGIVQNVAKYLVEKESQGGKQVVCINGDYEEAVQK